MISFPPLQGKAPLFYFLFPDSSEVADMQGNSSFGGEVKEKEVGRKHKAHDVCELGATQSLVFRDMSGSKLPKSTASKCNLFPQPITFVFEKQGMSDYRKETAFLQSFLTFVTLQT